MNEIFKKRLNRLENFDAFDRIKLRWHRISVTLEYSQIVTEKSIKSILPQFLDLVWYQRLPIEGTKCLTSLEEASSKS